MTKIDKITKYGWLLLIIVPLILAFVVFVKNDFKMDSSLCPDNIENSEEKIAAFDNWTTEFYNNNPDATISDLSKARKDFYAKNGCTEVLERMKDYESGTIDEETRQLIEGVINEEYNNYINKNPQLVYLVRDYEDEFYSECEEIDANVWHTECIIEKLDRAAAIREWKQIKLEGLEHPEVNIHELAGGDYRLTDAISAIKAWRENFEFSRQNGCAAMNSFLPGMSGIPGIIAKCELDYEIFSLEALDKVYYSDILESIFDSKGIPDFEPTQENIGKIMKTNKTDRANRCVWAGDPACDL